MTSAANAASFINAGVISSGCRAHNNMLKAGESQKKRLCIGHLQTRARPWPECMFVMLLSNNVPVCDVPPLCALIVLSHD